MLKHARAGRGLPEGTSSVLLPGRSVGLNASSGLIAGLYMISHLNGPFYFILRHGLAELTRQALNL